MRIYTLFSFPAVCPESPPSIFLLFVGTFVSFYIGRKMIELYSPRHTKKSKPRFRSMCLPCKSTIRFYKPSPLCSLPCLLGHGQTYMAASHSSCLQPSVMSSAMVSSCSTPTFFLRSRQSICF